MLRSLFRKWRESRNASLQLDAILAAADPDALLADRNQWLIELAYWLRRDGNLDAGAEAGGAGSRSFPVHVRLRYLLQVLARHPDWADSFARTVRSIVRDNDPTSLFCD
ncbi:MAG TPA: recombinase, partial [Cupriavidus sp.]|nr:recombinase [Cupriavidus sp.]